MSWQNRCQSIQLPATPEAFYWIVDLQEISEQEAEEAKYFLDDTTFQRSQRFIFQPDRHRSIVSHACLRVKISEMIRRNPSNITLLRNQYGKPYIEGNEIYFNLSHTKKMAFIGIHPSRPIGVDIEHNERSLRVDHSTSFISSDPLKETPQIFLRSWCAEEAYLKAIGTGFTSQRPKLDLHSSHQGIDLFRKDGNDIRVYNESVLESKLAVCLL